ncbi:MAG TPA: S16 family serine protease, partial [Planctomycetota bacterium]|nr:S16 family serine protease [Planctomycetota bacterium]
DKEAAAKVAADLVEYAQGRARAARDFHVLGDYRKLIRVAYQLSPEAPGVAAAHVRIKSGLLPEPPKKEVARADLMPALVALAKTPAEGKGRDDRLAARYLYAVGTLIDPQDETCMVQSDALQKKWGFVIAWDKILAVYRRVVPDGHTAAINGLMVMTASGTTQVGAVSRILLTYRATGVAVLDVRFVREGGSMMQVAGEEAVRYWGRIQRNVPLPGGTLEISFEDKFSKKDGPSAGAAYAILMRSFSDPFQIDPAFAMTGDISVEGRILQVGGVYAKIRGAAAGQCTRVGIPLLNEAELTDSLVLNGPSTLTEIEVFGMETIEDAVALARTDKDDRLQKAAAAFAGLRPLVEKKVKTSDKAATAEIQKITDAVLALAPRHLSAKLIDAWNNMRLPATLSLGGSLEESQVVFRKYLVTISTKETPDLADIANESKPTNISNTLRALRELKPKLHPDAQKSSAKLEDLCTTIQRFIQARPGLEEKEKGIETFKKKIEDLKLKIERAKAENKPVDEVNRLVKRHNQAVEDQKQAVDAYNKSVTERNQTLQRVVELHNEYIAILRTLTQDPKLLEKLIQGK